MEKINFIDKLLKEWISLTPRKQLLYVLGLLITCLILTVGFLFKYFNNEITKLKNEHAIMVTGITNRYDANLHAQQEETKRINEAFIKYLENNEKEVRELLYKTEKYEERIKKQK